MKKDWQKIGEILSKFIFNILWCSGFMWLSVNLFTLAFKIPFYLTILQAISINFLSVMLMAVFGIGGRSNK